MCNFLSAILTKDGKLLCDPEHTDSHEDLILAHHLNDGQVAYMHQNFVRLEFVLPQDFSKIDDLSKWQLRLDESEKPDWFDEPATRIRFEQIVDHMFVRDQRPLLMGGTWILLDNAEVGKVVGARIVAVGGNATIQDVWGNATIQNVRGNATIQNVWDNATIQNVWGNATIQDVWGNATIQDVGDNATIQDVWGNATIQDVWDNATIQNVRDNATIQNDYRNK